MMKKNECCGTCRWHEHEDIDDGWVCVNPESEYCTDWTDYEHKGQPVIYQGNSISKSSMKAEYRKAD